MFQFSGHSEKLPFLHDQRFTLQWNIPRCKWMLIHYVNSQKKPWYKRTERPYRFRRWFLRGAKGSFSNLANIREPRITIYIFRFLFCFPRKIVIPMRVNRLDIRERPLSADLPKMHTHRSILAVLPGALPERPASPDLVRLNMRAELPAIYTRMPLPTIQTDCTWPVSEWIGQGILHKDNLHLLQNSEHLPDYA